MPDDPDIDRLWTIAVIAKEFGLSPLQVAHDLDRDPEQLCKLVIPLLRYSECKSAYDTCDKNVIKPWLGSKILRDVEKNSFADAEQEIKRQNV